MITTDKKKQQIIDNFKEKLIGKTVVDVIFIETYLTPTIAIKFDSGLSIIGVDSENGHNVMEIFGE